MSVSFLSIIFVQLARLSPWKFKSTPTKKIFRNKM